MLSFIRDDDDAHVALETRHVCVHLSKSNKRFLCFFFQIVRMWLPLWLLCVCLWLLSITEVWAATFKLALIGPWSCDPMFSRAMPTAAANLALSRLRSDSSLSRGYWYDVKLLDEDCSTSKGLFRCDEKSFPRKMVQLYFYFRQRQLCIVLIN